jgi:hypothetical protein
MEASGHFHAPAELHPQKRLPLLFEMEAGWAPEMLQPVA